MQSISYKTINPLEKEKKVIPNNLDYYFTPILSPCRRGGD